MRVLHVGDIRVSQDTGFGRILWHWFAEMRRRGWTIDHIGPEETRAPHPGLFPWFAALRARRMGVVPDLVMAHEAAGGAFLRRLRTWHGRIVPLVVHSQGLERRGWYTTNRLHAEGHAELRARSRLLFPLWRLRVCETGLRSADLAMLISREDLEFAALRYGLEGDRVAYIRNGVSESEYPTTEGPEAQAVAFIGSWIARKGIHTLAAAARRLAESGRAVRWLLAGTGVSADDVYAQWPTTLRDSTRVIPRFAPHEEAGILASAKVVALPSYFEGQPLTLLQAMAAGRCCISTDCCGQRDFIAHGENGLLHSPGDADGLAALLDSALSSARLRMHLGAGARKAMSGRSWSRVSSDVADHLETAYTRATFGRRAGSGQA